MQPLKDFIIGSSPSVNRKLLTHILTNVTHPPTHLDIQVGLLQKDTTFLVLASQITDVQTTYHIQTSELISALRPKAYLVG